MTDTLLSAARQRIKVGDLVMVAYPLNEYTNNPARKFDGQEFVVKSKHQVAGNMNRKYGNYYFELYRAVSDMGAHYAFLEDELIKL